jgi:hypothetical protein
MRKVVALIVLALGVFAYFNRERLFVRDPLGSLTRNGAKESGAQIFVNFSNDVLIENDNAPMYFNLLEHGRPVSAPTGLKCIHYLVCLVNGYPSPDATVLPQDKLESMSERRVQFRDWQGREVEVTLR